MIVTHLTYMTFIQTWCPSPQGPIQEQRKEIAAVIQRCYKRYKQVTAHSQQQAITSFMSSWPTVKYDIRYPEIIALTDVFPSLDIWAKMT